MNRRALIKALGSVVLLAGGLLPSVVFSQSAPKLLVPPEITSPLFHVLGTLPEPVEIKRIFAVDTSASVLVNSVAPKQLLGWSFEPSADALPWLSQFSRALPVVGHLDTESLVALRPNIIVEVAEISEQALAQAKRVHEQTGITYVLVEGSFEDTPEQVRTLGALLGHQRHGQQLAVAAQEVLDGVIAKQVAFKGKAPTIYVAQSANGLKTVAADSTQSEVIRLVGAKNVVNNMDGEALEELPIEQIALWNPDVILTQDKSFYDGVYDNPLWKDLSAVKNKKVFFVPNIPFDWLNTPSSINRLFGALWLSSLLQDEDQKVLIDQLRHLFILYFAYDPGQQRLQELLDNPAAYAA